MNGPLDVAFVWHMHQPYYRISDTGAFEMPWVRMHAVKDYAEMVEILDRHSGLHQTFNVVPSLVEQLQEYQTDRYVDTYQEHTRKPAADLSPSEQAFVLGVICERSFHPRARRYPRYLELAQKRDRYTTNGRVQVAEFSPAELRDVQVLFDLAWFHPTHLKEGPLADLAKRGRDFTEQDKETIRTAQATLLSRILPTYRTSAAAGQVELTTSPYYHPILPLLMNSDMARISLPGVELPTRRFDHPEDADEQIREALRLHREVFGEAPQGMWCSEQTVGEDVIAPLAGHGIAWTVSDEAVLARSLGHDLQRDAQGRLSDPGVLYSSYRLEREHGTIDIVFRDRMLSDLVGFTYQDWDPADAAADLLRRLRQTRHDLTSGDGPNLVTIALDGENAWEYYPDEGRDFLERLYEGLQEDPSLRCVTVSEHLRENPPGSGIPWLHTGSWIGGDVGTWVGDRAHRPAWDLLHDARAAATASRASSADRAPDIGAAWREILIAEGSDWFWWFGDHQESGLDEVWDAAFRRHLQQAYRLAGLTPPPELFAPILGHPPRGVDGFVTPVVDGRLTTPDEWDRAIRLSRAGGGAMQRSEGHPVVDLRFGWSQEALSFLVVPRFPLPEGPVDVAFYLSDSADSERDEPSGAPDTLVASLGFKPRHRLLLTLSRQDDRLSVAASLSTPPFGETPSSDEETGASNSEEVIVAAEAVVEVAVPWTALGARSHEPLLVGGVLSTQGRVVDVFPSTGARATPLP